MNIGSGATLVDVDLIGGLGQPTPSLAQAGAPEVGLSSLEDIMGLSLGGDIGGTQSFNLLDSLGGMYLIFIIYDIFVQSFRYDRISMIYITNHAQLVTLK